MDGDQVRKTKLTEPDWQRVLLIRCMSKQGLPISKNDQNLCQRAFREDGERYSQMEKEVFNRTVPFGSNAKLE